MRSLASNLVFVAILSSVANAGNHDIELFNVNQYGQQALNPCLVLSKDTCTGDTEVFIVNEYGLHGIQPEAVIEHLHLGTWHIYAIDDFGAQEVSPLREAEQVYTNDSMAFYTVDEYGIRGLFPTAVVEPCAAQDEFRVHSVDEHGVRSLFPIEIIRASNNSYSIHLVDKFGICDVLPLQTIEVVSPSDVFGIVLLPSIERTVYNPAHSKIRAVRQHKATPDRLKMKSDWRSSKPGG